MVAEDRGDVLTKAGKEAEIGTEAPLEEKV